MTATPEAISFDSAAQAFREALTVRNPKQVPQDWAWSQNNLVYALQTLSERVEGEKAITLLQYAIDAYSKAQEVSPKDKFPKIWEITQKNLDSAKKLREMLVTKGK